MIETLSLQLHSRFQGMKYIVEAYQVLQPQFSERFSEDISPLFPGQLLSVRASFQDMLTQMKIIKELAHLLVTDSASLTSSYLGVCTAC